MAQTVLDNSNIGEFLEKGKVPAFKEPEKPKEEPKAEEVKAEEPKVEAKKAAEPQDDDLTPEERATIGAKVDKIVGKKHKAMMEAREAAKEAEEFAENQYRERRAAEKRAEEYEARLKELESKAAAPAVEAKEPDRKDFESDAEYWDAKIDWKAAEAVRKDRELRAKEDSEREQKRLDDTRIARNREFAKTVPDYEETVAALADEDLMVPPHISAYLLKSADSPLLMYHFAKHPDIFKRIAELEPILGIEAIGELKAELKRPKTEAKAEAKPEAKVEVKPPERTRAPEPIAPLAGNQGTVHKDASERSTREEIEYYEARRAANLHKRQRH